MLLHPHQLGASITLQVEEPAHIQRAHLAHLGPVAAIVFEYRDAALSAVRVGGLVDEEVVNEQLGLPLPLASPAYSNVPGPKGIGSKSAGRSSRGTCTFTHMGPGMFSNTPAAS
jgi:hypothetical protein